ncbi:MAG: UDP-N-acetyl-2-amino-2-deoxyglucuronate dehydrogenase [Limisphaerales bacterium]|jgi:UDP-N-acetyl-2-amino-2-deoxyglucuronate dehydrogenase
MSDTPFRYVIVGSGNISRTYLKAIERSPGLELAGTVSRSGRQIEGAPETLPVFPSITDVNVPFDAVILCTPNGLHHQGASEAAKLGKHVLTEKVLEISRENMDAMIGACEAAGVKLAVSYQRRMSPENQTLKKLLENGSLGRVFAADMRVKFWRDEAYYNSGAYRGGYEIDGGGPFLQQAAHNVDLFCWFFGMPEKIVSMLGTQIHDIEVEDHGTALLRYADGMLGSITASSACKPGFAPILDIHTDKGTVVLINDEITTWEIEGVENPAAGKEFEVHSGADSAAVEDTAGHEAILQDFAAAVRENRDPAVPASSGRLATDLVLQIYEANVR